MIFSIIITAKAQFNVPSTDFPYVIDAINYVKDSTDLAEATINVSEGYFLEPDGYRGEAGLEMKITVQGAGADKTFIKGFEDGELEPGKDIGRRYLNLYNTADDGTEFIFKNLTIQNWGYGNKNAGGFVYLGRPIGNVKLSFINVNFENCMAVRGAVAQMYDQTKTTIFDNCSFFNCLAFDNGSLGGILYARGTNLTVKNCLFMSNTIDVRDYSGDMTDQDRKVGGIVHLQATSKDNLNAILENNMFVNNLTESDMNEVLHPVIAFLGADDGTLILNVNLKNNIAIGNIKEGKETDVDLYYRDNPGLVLTAESNIVNSALRRVIEGEETSYDPVDVNGIEIQKNYSYENFNYIMDGDLPKVMSDEFGVKYIGDEEVVSIFDETNINNKLSVCTYRGYFIVDGLQFGEILEVYNITGQLYSEQKVNESRVKINVPQGIYILKADMSTRKAIMPY